MKAKSWTIINPDGSETVTNYDPFEKKREDKKLINEWHNMVVTGLVNGLTHTIWDERREDINWVRKRLTLWESFGRCMYSLHNNQSYEMDEKDLKEVSKEGYKK